MGSKFSGHGPFEKAMDRCEFRQMTEDLRGHPSEAKRTAKCDELGFRSLANLQ
jgi:hypothetical protein